VDVDSGRGRAAGGGPHRRARRGSGVGGAPGALARGLAMVRGGRPRARGLLAGGGGRLRAARRILGGRRAAGAGRRDALGARARFLAVLFVTDGLGEELAWRGFALPRLLTRYNALVASLGLGVLWGAWHLPLVWTEGAPLYQQPVWLLLLDITAKSVLFTWVFLHTRGSVLLAALLHATTNLFVVSPVIAEGGSVALLLLAAAAKWVVVVIVVAVAGPGLAKGPRPEALAKAH
jgi:hypothetical protein